MPEFLISIGIEGLEAVVDLDELREKDKKIMNKNRPSFYF